MTSSEFQKIVAALPRELRAEVVTKSAAMSEEQLTVFTAALSKLIDQDDENLDEEKELVNELQLIVVEAEHAMAGAEKKYAYANEENEQASALHHIESDLDQA